MKYLLMFDIPRNKNTLRNRIHRRLVKNSIKKLQDSIWFSEDEELLIDLAKEIKKSGASARVIKFEEIL